MLLLPVMSKAIHDLNVVIKIVRDQDRFIIAVQCSKHMNLILHTDRCRYYLTYCTSMIVKNNFIHLPHACLYWAGHYPYLG